MDGLSRIEDLVTRVTFNPGKVDIALINDPSTDLDCVVSMCQQGRQHSHQQEGRLCLSGARSNQDKMVVLMPSVLGEVAVVFSTMEKARALLEGSNQMGDHLLAFC